MPGTPSGSVDHVTNASTAANANQEFFTNLFRFYNGPLRSGSYVELVALNYGLSGTGMNFHNENNPFGENAWVCWRVRSGSVPAGEPSIRRAHDYYVFFQWADTSAFGAAPGAPAVISAGTTDGVGVQIAWRADGGNPWNGTSAGAGADTKGTPVWTAGTSSVYVLPRSNGTGGTYATNKQNCYRIYDLATTATSYRYHFIADRDCFVTFIDSGDNTSYDASLIFGTFEPISGIVTSSGNPGQMPMAMFGSSAAAGVAINANYGDTAGSTAANGGTVPLKPSGVETSALRLDGYTNVFSSDQQPNPQYTLNRFDEFRWPILTNESNNFGLMGFFDSFCTEIYTTAGIHDINSGSTRAVLGNTAARSLVVVPWSGAAPGSTSTRAGRQW